jgi:hypothetical protein
MPATMPADFAFVPKVWDDAISAYFPKKLVFGAVADLNDTLTQKPGTTIDFPYFKQIGPVEKPAANEDLEVDKMQDDSFSAIVQEVGKAVSIRRAALMTSSQEQDRIFGEIQSQMARVHAEGVDADLITEVNTVGSYTQGFTSADTERATVKRLLRGGILAFGDRSDEIIAYYMHSLTYADVMSDSDTGFLKADANMPFWNQPGFMGMLLGRALFVSDQCPLTDAVSGKKTYTAFAVKAKPYGIIRKASVMPEQDYDLLSREYVFSTTQWYGVKSFHSKVSADDKRVARFSFQTEYAA